MKIDQLLIAIFCLLGANRLSAQYVTIPDANFVTKLQAIVPAAMSGNQMDTTHTSVTSLTSLNVSNSNISNLDGVQYFDGLGVLNCYNNQIVSLPNLPANLTDFGCYNNQLSSLPSLPGTLTGLNCSSNQLSSLPPLPASMIALNCNSNQLSSLPSLPSTLTLLDFSYNQFSSMPVLPASLTILFCGDNQLTSISSLPAGLTKFYCSSNQLTSLPSLPATLTDLNCSANQLTSIPALPAGLTIFYCSTNLLTSLPSIPASLTTLVCNFNQITSLPSLPDGLNSLYCNSNAISCLPPIPQSVSSFNITVNQITCIPNETVAFNEQTTGLPVCLFSDPVNNPNGCQSYLSLFGNVYKDEDINCSQGMTEDTLQNIPVLLKDNITGNVIAQTYSTGIGRYSFYSLDGSYSAFVDTASLLAFIEPTCANSSFSVTAGQVIPDVNLGIRCNGGFDIGVHSVIEEDVVFPGLDHTLRVVAGDLSSWYGLHCGTSGLTGQVQITVSGPVSYNGTPFTALTPTVNGNVYTYDIADFSTVDIVESFALNFTTDTTAQSGDTVSVYVTVTTFQPGDGDLSNNTFSHSYLVVNSYDPNMKEVYPVDVLPGYNDYFTYTIHFQNMGSAPAINIRLADTLDSHLDLSTFEVLSFSHENEVHLTGNNLLVRFPNINLVSNTVDEEASKGYVQYRIKPYPNQQNGTVIPNTAYIYFDYNPAVITNTTENWFLEDLSVQSPVSALAFSIYPNPTNGNFTIQTEKEYLGSFLRILDVSGKIVLQTQLTTTTQLVSAELDGGVYIILMENPGTGTSAQKRLVVSK